MLARRFIDTMRGTVLTSAECITMAWSKERVDAENMCQKAVAEACCGLVGRIENEIHRDEISC